MIDWGNYPDAERTPDTLIGAWRVKGTRIRCKDILDQFDGGCTAEEIAASDIFSSIPLDVVRRILRLAGRDG
jgi:uncharacterized protein (DUF433 family)